MKLGMPQVRNWNRNLSYELDPPANNRSLCDYLSEVDEKSGMRAYIDFIFRIHYSGPFAHWALAQELPEVKERTMVMCYDELSSPETDLISVNRMIDFWYNGTQHREFHGIPPGQTEAKGHGTSHNPAIRERLKALVKQIDEEYYDGQIAWIHSTLPCQHVNKTTET